MEKSSPRRHLDEVVVNTELTLLSITQAIALSFLVEASVEPLVNLELQWWPYIATGLLIILVFWSRSLMHVVTIIRWPLEFAHNFIYIAFTLVESVMFRQIGSVQSWFALSTANTLLVWLLFFVDLSMIRRVREDPRTQVSRQLISLVDNDQRLQLRFVVPIMIILSAFAWLLVAMRPVFFIEQGWHLLLVGIQLVFLLGYLWRSLGLYRLILVHMDGPGENRDA